MKWYKDSNDVVCVAYSITAPFVAKLQYRKYLPKGIHNFAFWFTTSNRFPKIRL